ncbi:hypothetical protein F2Q68_00005874 [Brassica cretica]|uniref:Uncharacterized protein n=1 Tax=Brassica cretica TaxID=69181 RepID=A0A8S9JMD0_BRACR|nr:hypothetical protein F2Q68_00005874 [Brassica cretica]
MEGLPQPPSVRKRFFLLAWFPGGGGLYNSAVAGSCSREAEALLALRRRHLWPLSVKAFGSFGSAGVVVVSSRCPVKRRQCF